MTRRLDLIERPGGILDAVCPECRRVAGTVTGDPDTAVIRLRIIEATHQIECPAKSTPKHS